MRIYLIAGLMISGLLIGHPALSQTEPAEPAAAAATPAAPTLPCASEKHRQFDFWVGQWNVTQNGQPAGTNRIELLHRDCTLNENWVSSSGQFSGSSFNIYDAANNKWHQTWVDSAGTLLELDGGLVDGKMVLQGQRPGANGVVVKQRITWTPNEDGSVRQQWDTSTDGDNWTTIFDGLYVRVAAAE